MILATFFQIVLFFDGEMIPKLTFILFIHVWLSYQLVKIGQVIQVVTQLDPPIVSGQQAIHLDFCNLSTGEEHDVGSSI